MGLDKGREGIMKNKKKKRVEEEDKDSEDWCFCCYDGGDLMICDHKSCLKVYHPGCVGKKKNSMYSGKRWTCSRHSCVVCSGTSRFYCLCCPHALCRDCIGASELALLRGKNGLCKSCVKRILLAKENSEYGLEGEKIDLEDQDEWLFKEYWEIVKEKEGLTSGDVYSANADLKKRENQSCRFLPINISESDKSKDLTMSDSDTSGTGVTEIQKPMRLRKGSKRLEFIGWGSKPLIEFLRSIGKDTTEKISQLDLDNIICNYIRDKELYVTKDKRKALCDQSLRSIFRTKFVFLVRIYGLLGEHLVENITEDSGSEDEEEIKLEDKNNGTTHERKKRRVSSDTTIASDEKKASPRFQKSCFASIIPENMKLVYIKRSLLEKLLKEPDHSESKVLGSFVRVKNNPLDYLQRNTHQFSQVKGIKEISATNGEGNKILLQLSYFGNDIPLSLLSDSNFSQEECEDLCQNVANGYLKKPTVVEFEKKARELHQDITKHWIEKELVRLQNCVDWANEKGWRRELDEYLDQRELLKKPSEQERLLKQMPEVIAEVIDLESGSGSTDSLVINKA
ncbi:uncharacterized protein At5g08430-like isoform X2 [Rosa rugosa]|uniref:uncharacterized protein At5g08430-like isoform X2 n=1 Tax=Rosa rugosa TaxID=74645 RepID=UPI002B403460|nr:uncharacterized protein At5g08430-like isoform X2 [Rosa rugosa]